MKHILYFILTISIISCGNNSDHCSIESVDFYGQHDLDSMRINIDLNRNEPKQTLSIQREPIEIFNDENKSFIVLQIISSEPGYQDGYDIVSIPLYELFELKSGKIELDLKATDKYNLENFEDFETISNMTNPVYGFKNGQREIIEEK